MADVTSVLVLAGTTEATGLAEVLTANHGVDVVSSLAGITSRPGTRAGSVRRGGFGGVSGLIDALGEGRFAAVIDATHPFAAVMPFHAEEAASATGTPLCRLLRPPWAPSPDDRWIDVTDLAEASRAIESIGARRVLLTIGRRGTGHFAASRARFLVRSIEPPDELAPRHELLLARGPFDVDHERDLLVRRDIDAVVSKNSGGKATVAKLVAARELGIPVVMVARPPQPDVVTVADVDHAVDWLDRTIGL